MLAKALAIFFIVVSASPVNAPFFTFDLGELLNHRAPGASLSLLDGAASVASSEEAEAPSAQPNLPVSVRAVDGSQMHWHLLPAIAPGSDSVDSTDARRYTVHGPAQLLRVAHTPLRAVLRL